MQLNSFADSNQLILRGASYVSFATTPTSATASVKFNHYDMPLPQNTTYYKPPLTGLFMLNFEQNSLTVSAVANRTVSGNNYVLDVSSKDPAFANFVLYRNWWGDCVGINNQNQFLVPYYAYDAFKTGADVGALHLVLISPALSQSTPPASGGLQSVVAAEPKFISVKGSGPLLYTYSFKDKFFMSCGEGVFRFSPDGSYAKVYPTPFDDQFTYRNNLYAFARTYPSLPGWRFVTSKDGGLTWTTLTDQVDGLLRTFRFLEIGDRLVAFQADQLFEFTITATTATWQQLDNLNLAGNEITSIAVFHNTVYVSTLSGVYTKPLSSFFTYKQG